MKLEPDEIRNNAIDDFFNKDESKSNAVTPLTIFFAVLAAILVAWFIRAAYVEWQVRKAVELFNQQMANITYQSQKQMKQIQLQNQQRIEAARRAQEEKALQLKLEKRRVEQERQAAISAGINERRKKEEAWERFYKPVSGCEASNDNKDLMKCGNDYARAKKKFEELWANNQLRQ
jgi:phosphoglycerate-specific signal transduction histidine kinase